MKGAPGLLLMFAPLLVLAGEEPPKDPVQDLPAGLRPGATATYARAAGGERPRGTVTFRVEKGPETGTVKLIREYATAKPGPLAMRDRLTAVLSARTRRILSFTYEVGKGRDGPYVTASRLGPHPKKKGSLLFTRFTYGKKGEKPTVRKTRLTLSGNWAPDLLEPFLVSLLDVSAAKGSPVAILVVLSGTVSRRKVVYRSLGEGAAELGKKKLPCRILSRVREGRTTMLYLGAGDGLPVKGSAFFLTRVLKEKE